MLIDKKTFKDCAFANPMRFDSYIIMQPILTSKWKLRSQDASL